ncbi:hypothetical protein SKAU_G00232060 [Synaphobranchus kaupii]|uniref:Uncharacterized protein n=1 Tax=Synaphobranchus kaupii TaxID=118154 RepID=A0A9Q1ISG3_SYNKA|nr:hypothetical protein SKAU_G00232060 [Synaphobranchus kaupii]
MATGGGPQSTQVASSTLTPLSVDGFGGLVCQAALSPARFAIGRPDVVQTRGSDAAGLGCVAGEVAKHFEGAHTESVT